MKILRFYIPKIPYITQTAFILTLYDRCKDEQNSLADSVIKVLDASLLEFDYEIQCSQDYVVRGSLGDRFSTDYNDYVLEYQDRINETIKFYEGILTWAIKV